MKRIFSILAIVCLVVALAVPAFATGTTKSMTYHFPNMLPVGGVVELPKLPNEIRDYEHIIIWQTATKYMYVAWNGDYEFYDIGNGTTRVNAVGNFSVVKATLTGSSWDSPSNTTVSSGDPIFWPDSRYPFLWSYHDLGVMTLNNETFEIPGDINYTYFVYPECDGSTCSAIDINFDDICDECGLTLAYNLRQTPDSYEVVVKHSDSLTLLYRYTETIDGTTFSAVYNDSRVTISFNNPVDHYQYKLVNGEWEEYASYPNTTGSHAISLSGTAEIESSDLIVYDTSGNVFFQNPLWKMILGLTQGEMITAVQAVVGTMKVLALCGVGLIALLVVLKLFGKRSLLYRG